MTAATSLQRALRRLRRAPGFTVTALITLALGLGAAATVFAVVYGVLLRPLPYRDSGQLVQIFHSLALPGLSRVDQSDATYLVYRDGNHSFSDVGAYRAISVNLVPGRAAAGPGPAPERVSAALATASTFSVLGVHPVLGRGLTAGDEAPGAEPVVLLGDGLWRREFGADPGVVGRLITVDGRARRIAGVMPAGFRFPDARTALWLPLPLDPANTRSAAFDYRGIARLRPGVSVERARADLARLLPTVPEVYPGRLMASGIAATHMTPVVQPLRAAMVGDVRRILWTVLGAVGVLLLLACVNVANLFLARAEARQHELGLLRALGAGRAALAGEFLWEAGLLAGAGVLLGLAGAAGALALLRVLPAATRIPRLGEVGIGPEVAGAMALVAAVVALGIGAIGLLRSRAGTLAAALRAEGRAGSITRRGARARRGLVTAQVGLALVLLAAAGVLARSFARLRAEDPGFAAKGALAFRLALPEASYPEADAAGRTLVDVLAGLESLPGVQAAGAVTQLPLDQESRQDSAVFVQDRPVAPGRIPGIHPIVFATPGYFRAMGIPLVAGRFFAPPDATGDATHAPREVVVSRAFAQAYWPGGNALGKRVRLTATDPWSTIVGVVGDVRDLALDRPPAPAVYVPLVTVSPHGTPWTPRDVAFVVRALDATELTAAIRAVVERVAPELPLYRVAPLGELVAGAVARTRFILLLLGAAALIALVIGAAGIYGMVAYLVSARTREIGVRCALGASPARVRQLVLREALRDAAAGVLLGLLAEGLLTRGLAGLLFHVSPVDPATLAAAAAGLLLTAALASWIPARRAAAVDPANALRAE